MRAARLRTCRMPRPLRRILSPFFRLLAIISTTWLSISLAWRLGTSCISERRSAMLRSVRIGDADAAEAFAVFFTEAFAEALLAALGAAAFLADLAGAFAAFDVAFAAALGAAAFLAGAFLEETLVAVLAIRNSFF